MCASRKERWHGFYPCLKAKFCGKTHQILNTRYWTEIRHDFREDSPVGCGDVVAAVSVDAWRTSDDDAEGEVIARVFLTKKGDVVIDYINAIARTDVLAQISTPSLAPTCWHRNPLTKP